MLILYLFTTYSSSSKLSQTICFQIISLRKFQPSFKTGKHKTTLKTCCSKESNSDQTTVSHFHTTASYHKSRNTFTDPVTLNITFFSFFSLTITKKLLEGTFVNIKQGSFDTKLRWTLHQHRRVDPRYQHCIKIYFLANLTSQKCPILIIK